MEIVFKKNPFFSSDVIIDYNSLIGLTGEKYELFFHMIDDKIVHKMDFNDEFYTNDVWSEILLHSKVNDLEKSLGIIFRELGIDKEFVKNKISDLSNSDKVLLKYVLMLLSNKDIYIINEPFIDLDYLNKKKIINLLKRIVHISNKTIIIGSMNINDLYSICKKVLIVGEDVVYGDNSLLTDKNIALKYKIDIPSLVSFIDLMHDKNIDIEYTNDIRDLMKDVYRNAN